jgi:ABC-type antimicrobial peptide transport system permease subunit
VVAYAVNQRRREMGIRLALGATAGAVIRFVVRGGMRFPIIGLVVGVAGSLAMSRVLSSSLYEVSPTDPLVFARTVALLLVVSAAACLVPAVRATRVDPLEAMRAE